MFGYPVKKYERKILTLGVCLKWKHNNRNQFAGYGDCKLINNNSSQRETEEHIGQDKCRCFGLFWSDH